MIENTYYTKNISKNTYFYYEYFSNFIKKNPLIPLCNRDYIKERVDEFYQKILEYKTMVDKTDDSIPYFNILHTAFLNKELYICDGQHRYYAYKKYYEFINNNNNNNNNSNTSNKSDFQISYVVKICNSKDELKQYFRDLNNIFILHEIILKDDEIDKLERIKTYMKSNYNKHISKSQVPKFPNINIDQLSKYLIDTYPTLSYIELLNKIELLNNGIKNDLEINNKTYYDSAMKKEGFFLGYLFIKTEMENKRKSIPKTVRESLWSKNFGEELNGNCYSCKNRVSYHNFHAGHKISVKHGGDNNINNLEVLCFGCNLSMGPENLEEFKKKYF